MYADLLHIVPYFPTACFPHLFYVSHFRHCFFTISHVCYIFLHVFHICSMLVFVTFLYAFSDVRVCPCVFSHFFRIVKYFPETHSTEDGIIEARVSHKKSSQQHTQAGPKKTQKLQMHWKTIPQGAARSAAPCGYCFSIHLQFVCIQVRLRVFHRGQKQHDIGATPIRCFFLLPEAKLKTS